jgi:hypothetical protein
MAGYVEVDNYDEASDADSSDDDTKTQASSVLPTSGGDSFADYASVSGDNPDESAYGNYSAGGTGYDDCDTALQGADESAYGNYSAGGSGYDDCDTVLQSSQDVADTKSSQDVGPFLASTVGELITKNDLKPADGSAGGTDSKHMFKGDRFYFDRRFHEALCIKDDGKRREQLARVNSEFVAQAEQACEVGALLFCLRFVSPVLSSTRALFVHGFCVFICCRLLCGSSISTPRTRQSSALM